MQVIGHRGVVDPAGPVENTLGAVRRGIAEGADGVEVDVRLTSDGATVCVHDPDLRRVAGAPIVVASASRLSLLELRLPGGERIPTAAEVVREMRGQGLVVLDLKPVERRLPALVAAVVAAVSAEVFGEQIVLSSTDPVLLDVLGVRLPYISRALISGPGVSLVEAVGMVPADVDLHPHVESVLADALTAARLIASGRTLRCWTVNRAVDAQLLDVLGIAAVITDRPGAICQALSVDGCVTSTGSESLSTAR